MKDKKKPMGKRKRKRKKKTRKRALVWTRKSAAVIGTQSGDA